MKIAAVVVTYNRLELLKLCINGLIDQTRIIDFIIVVNNSSTDGTEEWLKSTHSDVHVITQENTGGAGGFYTGFGHAIELGADWVWNMDDDCLPNIHALQEILNINPSSNTIYGSIALNEKDSSQIVWRIADEHNKGNYFSHYNELIDPLYYTSQTIPFLGIFVPKQIISEIGLPQKELVIWNDDEEYCYRAKSKGYKLCYAVRSILTHPPVSYKRIRFLFLKTYIYETTPQKNRYFFRNSTYVARKYNSFLKFYFLLLPVKVVKAVLHSYYSVPPGNKLGNFRSYLSAIKSGIRGELGLIK